MTSSVLTSNEPSTMPQLSRKSWAARALSSLVRTYQRLYAGRPSPCRYYPSCSEYALEALSTHGALKGAWLSVRRIVRCRPFGKHGIDLVPLKKVSQ